jgi:hypothetical protein
MSSSRKSIKSYYSKAGPKTILTCTNFARARFEACWVVEVYSHDRVNAASGDENALTEVYGHGSDCIETMAVLWPTCGGIGHAAERHAEVRRLDARPCDGK